MLLQNLLQNLQGTNVKVGANSMFLYCGENNEQAKETLNKYLDREVIEYFNGISYDEPNTTIIHIVGNEIGRYFTIKEFKVAKLKVQVRKFKKVLTNQRAKLKMATGRTEQAKVQREIIKQQIEQTKEQINSLQEQIKSLTTRIN